MTVKMDALVVGRETKVSAKTGQTYEVICFMDGASPVTIMVKRDVPVVHVEPMNKYTLTISVDLGRYMKATILQIEECKT